MFITLPTRNSDLPVRSLINAMIINARISVQKTVDCAKGMYTCHEEVLVCILEHLIFHTCHKYHGHESMLSQLSKIGPYGPKFMAFFSHN